MSHSHKVVFLLWILGSAAAEPDLVSQYQTLFDSPDCMGNSMTVTAYVPNLASIGFDNKPASGILRGMWLYYDLVDYNWASEARAGYVFNATDSGCVNFFNPGIYSSIKYAGLQSNYTQDTITFYTFTWMQGAEEMVTADMPMLALDLRISSLIFTGTSSWTIYDQPNYQGNSLCLQTPNANIAIVEDTTKITPKVPHGSISSVRKGCFSMNTVSIGGSPTAHAVNNQAGDMNIPFM